MKIITVIGTRPQAIKIDPTLPNQIIVWTGQHYDKNMSSDFFDELDIPAPKYNLGCRSNNVGKMVDKLGGIFMKEKPDMVVVIGDTNSTLAGALAAAYKNIPVAHIEAGMRSGRRDMPEEINRILTDHIAKVKFCPNSMAEASLLKEGIVDDVYVVGDPEVDSMFRFIPIKRAKNYRKYILLTLHRNYNTDSKERLENIFWALKETGEKFIFPIHPRTRNKIEEFKIKIPRNIKLIDPVSYGKMLSLISNAKKVVTDSGGVQREAYWMNIPLIILRNETEWGEIITKQAAVLVDADREKIIEAVKNFKGWLNSPPLPGANKKIKEILFKYL